MKLNQKLTLSCLPLCASPTALVATMADTCEHVVSTSVYLRVQRRFTRAPEQDGYIVNFEVTLYTLVQNETIAQKKKKKKKKKKKEKKKKQQQQQQQKKKKKKKKMKDRKKEVCVSFLLSKAINLTCFYAVCTFITSDFGDCSCV